MFLARMCVGVFWAIKTAEDEAAMTNIFTIGGWNFTVFAMTLRTDHIHACIGHAWLVRLCSASLDSKSDDMYFTREIMDSSVSCLPK